jgi:tetratricopeptide (TPR) repeat protein
MALFFDRFRGEVARYAEGVHRLGTPASASEVARLPRELGDFLRSWNGAELFVDAYTIYDAAHLVREGSLLFFGESATGDRFALDLQGDAEPSVLRLEEDTEETLIEGTSFARWIEALVVGDGVLYDREGDYKDDVVDETGEELSPAVVEKRERKVLKIDPDAPAPAWRLARALTRLHREAEARKLLDRLVARAPAFAWAHFDRGKLLAAEGDLEKAEEAFLQAGSLPGPYAAFFVAHAARAAADRGDEASRRKHAERALELRPDLARLQKEAAQARAAEGVLDESRELVALARALAPRDLELLELARRLRG